MTPDRSLPLLRRRLRTAALSLLLSVSAGAGLASSAQAAIGVVPPSEPAANCTPAATDPLAKIDACRASEGIGPVVLPANWAALSADEQLLVIFDLERTARGLAPIIGLNSELDRLSQIGASQNGDPSFPASGILGGGGVWAAAPSALEADFNWMYNDGPGSENLDCSALSSGGCWGHRNNILIHLSNEPLIGGAGFAAGNWQGVNSYAAEMDYVANMTSLPIDDVAWSAELPSFSSPPGLEPLTHTTATSSTSAGTPSPGTSSGSIHTLTVSSVSVHDGTTTISAHAGRAVLRFRYSRPRLSGHRLHLFVRLLSGAARVAAVAQDRHRLMSLRVERRGALRQLSATLRPGRWTLRLQLAFLGHDARLTRTLQIRIR